MKKVVIGSIVLLAAINVPAQKTTKVTTKTSTKVTTPVFKNLLDSFSYAAGFNVATNMKSQGINQLNTSLMQKGIDDVFTGKPGLMTTEAAGSCMQRQLEIFAAEKGKAEKATGTAFLEANKKRPGVITLPSGLQYEIKKSGDPAGIRPILTDTVVVNYMGSMIDGVEFDNSFKRGAPITRHVTGFIAGWTEILQMMRVGDHWKIYVPSELGYGENGFSGAIPPNATLIFEISLEGIKHASTNPNN